MVYVKRKSFVSASYVSSKLLLFARFQRQRVKFPQVIYLLNPRCDEMQSDATPEAIRHPKLSNPRTDSGTRAANYQARKGDREVLVSLFS